MRALVVSVAVAAALGGVALPRLLSDRGAATLPLVEARGGLQAPEPSTEPGEAGADGAGAELVAELGCGACHSGVEPSGIGASAPALDDAGLRYRPAYLWSYLQDPTAVRRHIGRARMPDFSFDERESLALALYLVEQRAGDRERPGAPGRLRLPFTGRRSPASTDSLITRELGCTGCHSLGGSGEQAATELSNVAARMRSDWIERYLVDPNAWDPGTPMPSIFYTAESSGGRTERVPDAAEKIRAIVRRLDDLASPERSEQDRAYSAARRRYPEIEPDLGRRIFVAQNCAGCHTRAPAVRWFNAPSLAIEGSRVRSEWLRAFLRAPEPVRPFGHFPGSGSRMPDFRLTDAEADSITAYLVDRTAPDVVDRPAGSPLSAFARAKAEILLAEKLSCLGCHALDGKGGRVGPDLARTATRLRPGWIRAIVTDPDHVAPGTVMPAIPMPESTLDLIVAYLQTREEPQPRDERLSLVDHPIHLPGGADAGGALYTRYCAACHGEGGAGNGYNARYLPVRPTDHTNAEAMGSRPDDTLFDGIHAGGAVVGGSHRMPPFGGTLGREAIRALVAYIRSICGCVQPSWAADGAQRQGR